MYETNHSESAAHHRPQSKLSSFGSDSSDEFVDNKSLSKRKGLESLLAKKFSPSYQSDNLINQVNIASSEHGSDNQVYDDNNYEEEDCIDETFNQVEDNMVSENSLHGEQLKNGHELGEADAKEEEEAVSRTKISSTDTDNGEKDLKALNDYIRANCRFEFEKVSTYISSNSNTVDEQAYSLAEIENHESIRAIIEKCRDKFPELKYKISKSVKSAFKEKFRTALKLYSTTKLDPKSKAFSIKANIPYDSPNANRNISFKDIKMKNFQLSSESTKNNNLSDCLSPNDTWNAQNAHFLNPSSDLNKPAHKKLKGSTSSGDSCSNDSQQKTQPASMFNFTQAEYNLAFGPMANMLAQQAKTLSPAALKQGAGGDLNGALMPTSDGEFMKLAITNPLFRFSDFASTAASNPYFTNLFRSQNILSAKTLPSPTQSLFGMPPSSSPNPFPSYSSSMTSMSLPTNPITSPPVGNHNNNKNTHNSQQLNGKKSSPQPQVVNKPTNGQSNQYNHHENEKHSNNDKLNNHIQKTVHNDETGRIKLANALGNDIGPYFSPSSKLKLSSKFSKLSSTEIQTIKTLITGYRESAAFLSRSAEELETLINDSYKSTE